MNLPDEKREAVTEVLVTHRRDDVAGHCDCGWSTRAIGYTFRHEHEAHQADALAPLLAGWLAEAAAGEDAATVYERGYTKGAAEVRARVEQVAEDHAGTIAGMDLRAALDGGEPR